MRRARAARARTHSVASGAQSSPRHSRTLRSADADASTLPSGEKRTAVMESACARAATVREEKAIGAEDGGGRKGEDADADAIVWVFVSGRGAG